ncbi:MAG: hypothetical protein A2285_00350 [Elusimicrobia bacterium RIFOXYA12_FULL_57_11]|nr:MAG: hypothetical protein A2285_00350 [Elusimicrobia bacterium RIFOXYA12_FULL_57_11]
MKTMKAVILIILGSFFIATGFAFAGDNALNQLQDNPSFDGATKSGADAPVLKSAPPPAASGPAEIKPEPKPTLADKVNSSLAKHKTKIAMGALGAYIGFALVGTVLGACTFGAGFVILIALAAL